jgi:hypothetical protein
MMTSSPSELREWFVLAASFAAPFISDTSTHFVLAPTPAVALERLAREYRHSAGLYAAQVYESAEAFHKGFQPLARWLSNHAQAIERGSATISHGPGDVSIDGQRQQIEDPKAGAVMP